MANLTQEQINQILSGRPLGAAGTMMGGQLYQPVYGGNAQGEAGQGQEGALEQILGYDPSKTQAGVDQYGMYDPTGKYQGQGMFKEAKGGDLLAMGLLAALSMGAFLPGAMAGGAAGGAGGAAGGLAGGVGAAEGFAGTAGLSGLGAGGLGMEAAGTLGGLGLQGSTLGSLGAAGTGFGGLSAELAAAGMGGSLGGLAGAGLGAGEAVGAFNPAMDSQLANAAIEAGGGDALAGYSGMAGTTGITGVPGPSWWDSLVGGAKSAAGAMPGGANGLGALATTVLGGVLGSKGKEESATSTNKMDPRMDALLYGQNGLLGQVDALKNQQLAQGGLNDLQRQGMQMQQNWLMSPEYSQGFNSMRNVGGGLLGRGVAANPFAK